MASGMPFRMVIILLDLPAARGKLWYEERGAGAFLRGITLMREYQW
jgi:hypothetical protein